MCEKESDEHEVLGVLIYCWVFVSIFPWSQPTRILVSSLYVSVKNPAGLEMTSDLYKSRVMMSNVELRVLLIQGVNIVATSFLLLTVVAAHQAPEPSQPPASSSPPRFCSRPLAATLWGGAFAFFSLMADAWGASTAIDAAGMSSSSWSTRMCVTLLLGPPVPLVGIFPNFMNMVHELAIHTNPKSNVKVHI